MACTACTAGPVAWLRVVCRTGARLSPALRSCSAALRRLLEGMFGDAWIDFYPQNMAKADAHPFLLRFRDGNVRNSASL